MSALLLLLPCPLLLVLSSVLVRQPRTLSRLGAGLLWGQCGVTLLAWGPLLWGRDTTSRVVAGFYPDSTAALFVILTTLVAVSALTHAVGFFAHELATEHPPSSLHIRRFYFFVALFLLSMYAVVTADNLGFLWIAVEATTLLSAPLVYYHGSRTALEATWKYLMICSVGIAFAFFGTAMIYAASQRLVVLGDGSLSLVKLTIHAAALPPGLLRLGFVFVLLGYGTKAGLFPLHAWLPDAHSEAPAPASALLSGALLNCALVALWRISSLLEAAGEGAFIRATLLPMGVATVFAASLFLLKQRDLKRLLAYSSMENVGLMATAIALGVRSGFTLQAVNHSLVKVALFLLAGNLLQQYGTKTIRQIRGLVTTQPAQALCLLSGVIAVAGTPPFGSFVAEWQILTAAASGRYPVTVLVLCGALALAFLALSTHVVAIVFGKPLPVRLSPGRLAVPNRRLAMVPALLIIASLLLGVFVPPVVLALLEGVAQ